ncbi:MAG: thiamine pyrophosphate-binding protein [Methanobacterium sp.]|jgi:thiamine pyrophosphate-dependent acetolactate synthase large subunit-like protein/rubredoxin
MVKYRCVVCNYVFDEKIEGKKFKDLPDDWKCPLCNVSKDMFVPLKEKAEEAPKLVGKTVSDVLVDQLVEWGVKYVFGMPGTSVLGIIESIRKNDKIKYIQVRHEETAAFMASAYGKLTGHVAVCLTIAGPGSTNLATGLYDAMLDHSPVLAITGIVKRQIIGPGSFQEIDQYSFFRPVSVFDKILMSRKQTVPLVTLALKHAIIDGGVSHIGIPVDLQNSLHDAETLPFEGNFPNNSISQPEIMVKKAARIIDESHRPVIITGFGAMGQGDNIIEIADKISAPVVSTFRGKGVINEYHRLYVGSHGGIGSSAAAKLVKDSDLLIVIGCSFSDQTMLPEKRMVQIDINPMMIAKRHPVEAGLFGNSSVLVPELKEKVKENKKGDYLDEIRNLKQEWLDLLQKEADSTKTPIRPQYIVKVLNEKIADDAIITLDVGDNGWWFGRNFLMKKTQKMIFSGYLGSMAFSLPAAIAAQLIYPERQVICTAGDGGFSMLMADFMTAVKNELPIKVFIFNNSELAMIRQEQLMENYPNYETKLHSFDFAEYARNCGGVGIKVETPEELEEAVDEALELNKPVIVDINTDPLRFV